MTFDSLATCFEDKTIEEQYAHNARQQCRQGRMLAQQMSQTTFKGNIAKSQAKTTEKRRTSTKDNKNPQTDGTQKGRHKTSKKQSNGQRMLPQATTKNSDMTRSRCDLCVT